MEQTLIVTFGCGLHQRWGGPLEEIRPGDVVTAGVMPYCPTLEVARMEQAVGSTAQRRATVRR